MLRKYLIFLTVFISFILWIVIYVTATSFFIVRYFRNYNVSIQKLSNDLQKLKSIKNFSEKIDEILATSIVEL
jgi:biopolymer transport protein ExbB/TolQ